MFKSLELSHCKVLFNIWGGITLYSNLGPTMNPLLLLRGCLHFSTGSEWTKPGTCPATIYERKWFCVCDFRCLPLHYRNKEILPSLNVQSSCIQVLSEAALTHDGNPTSLPSLDLLQEKTPPQPYSAKTEV